MDSFCQPPSQVYGRFSGETCRKHFHGSWGTGHHLGRSVTDRVRIHHPLREVFTGPSSLLVILSPFPQKKKQVTEFNQEGAR